MENSTKSLEIQKKDRKGLMMEKKKGGGLSVTAVAIGILLVITAILCVILIMKGKVQKLDPVRWDGEQEWVSDTQWETEMEQVFDGFTVGKNVPGKKDTRSDTDEDSAEDAAGDENGYICSYSSSKRLTEDDISVIFDACMESMPANKSIPQMIINEMYAKYGYQFQNEEIQEYFENKAWYREIRELTGTSDMGEIYKGMSDLEKDNIEFLKSYEM